LKPGGTTNSGAISACCAFLERAIFIPPAKVPCRKFWRTALQLKCPDEAKDEPNLSEEATRRWKQNCLAGLTNELGEHGE